MSLRMSKDASNRSRVSLPPRASTLCSGGTPFTEDPHNRSAPSATLNACAEVQHLEQQAQVLVQLLVHGVEDFGSVRGFFEKEREIGEAEALHAEGADPFFPDTEVRDWRGGPDPGSIGKLERGGGKVGVRRY